METPILNRLHPMFFSCRFVFNVCGFLAALLVATPHDDGLPRVLCVDGQFACWSFGCVDSKLVCDGKQDCLDGSDEERCGKCQP